MDIFNFSGYSNIYDIFKKHFVGIELYLRAANFIDYVYNSNKSSTQINKIINDLKSHNKNHLELLTDVVVLDEMLFKWYEHFNKTNANYDFIDETLVKYNLCEDVLWNRLYKKYVDPDWNLDTKLWIADCPRTQTLTIWSDDSSKIKYKLKQQIVDNLYVYTNDENEIYVMYILYPKNLNILLYYSLLNLKFSYFYEFIKNKLEKLIIGIQKNSDYLNLNSDKFIPQYRQQLLDMVPLDDSYKSIRDDINNIPNNVPTYRKIKLINKLFS